MSMVETAPSKIQVRNLNFYYGKFHALKNINLDIAKNQVTAFIFAVRLRRINHAITNFYGFSYRFCRRINICLAKKKNILLKSAKPLCTHLNLF